MAASDNICFAVRASVGTEFRLGRFFHGAVVFCSFLAMDLHYGVWDKVYYHKFMKDLYGDRSMSSPPDVHLLPPLLSRMRAHGESTVNTAKIDAESDRHLLHCPTPTCIVHLCFPFHAGASI
jgi:hypothetical protein